MRRLGERRIKYSKWWNEEIRELIQKKGKDFGRILHKKSENFKKDNKIEKLCCEMGIKRQERRVNDT